MIFETWKKTPRLYRDIIITEKIDGQQAVIGISDDEFKVGSRSGWLDGPNDIHGFKAWAFAHEESLRADLGNGLHRGEWFGHKIYRGYNLQDNRLALFNTALYDGVQFATPNLTTTPVLYKGVFSEFQIKMCLNILRHEGSFISPGFMRPEGICIYHTQSNTTFKVLLENDHLHKGQL